MRLSVSAVLAAVIALAVAPLPRDLVAAGLLEVARIPGHVAVRALSRRTG